MLYDIDSLARQWFYQVWNQKRAEAVAVLAHPDAVVHGLGDGPGGVTEFHAFRTRFLNAFPDLQILVDEVITSGDRAAVRFHFTGTHEGDGLGIAPTGKRIEVTGISIIHYRDGRLIEGWNEFDAAGMTRQLSSP